MGIVAATLVALIGVAIVTPAGDIFKGLWSRAMAKEPTPSKLKIRVLNFRRLYDIQLPIDFDGNLPLQLVHENKNEPLDLSFAKTDDILIRFKRRGFRNDEAMDIDFQWGRTQSVTSAGITPECPASMEATSVAFAKLNAPTSNSTRTTQIPSQYFCFETSSNTVCWFRILGTEQDQSDLILKIEYLAY